MKSLTFTAIALGLLLPMMAEAKDDYWQPVWEKERSASTPETVERYFRQDTSYDKLHYLAKGQLYRLAAGLPVDNVASAKKVYGVDRWTGPKSTCTVEDQRQYRRYEGGAVSYASGKRFFYFSMHRVRDKNWDPCAEKMKPHKTRMEKVLKTEYRWENAQ